MYKMVQLIFIDGNEEKTAKRDGKTNVSHDEDDNLHVAILCVVNDGWQLQVERNENGLAS